jgi:putative membrane-bound dehydrogenase-like protein
MELVASEPLIKDPVDIEFNEDGDALVVEMPGYPFEEEQSRIVLLKDKNNDGIFDEAITYAENLRQSTSLLCYKGGVLVSAPPYLLFLEDNDHDNKADAIDTLMGGFSSGNLQHNYNGLTYGLDNWIYAANGGNSGKPFWWGDSTSVMDLRGQDFRFNLDKHVMERIGESSGGFGLGMDEWGHLFETHNLTHISHLVFPDRYIKGTSLLIDHSLSTISDHEENGLARIYPIGEQESRVNHPEQSGYFSGSCGITYYGGDVLLPEHENTVWVADVVLNLVHVDKIKPNGTSLTATRMMDKKEFLASTDRSFRPVNMTVGPNGAMYLVDMYRKVIEHPEWIPDEIEKTLDLNAGKDKGRIYKISKKGITKSFDFKKMKSIDGLVESLSHKNQWVRKTAHRLLIDQSLDDQQINSLSQLLNSQNPLARLHSLWILHVKGKLSPEQLMKAMKDSSPGVRENALIIAESVLNTNDSVFREVLLLLTDEDQRVRMQAALTLSTLQPENLDQYKENILDALIIASSNSSDDYNVAAITLASLNVSTELFRKLCISNNALSKMRLLSSLALSSKDNTSDKISILNALIKSNLSNDLKAEIVHQLVKGMPREIRGIELVSSINELEKAGNANLVSELAALRNKLKLPVSQEFTELSKVSLAKVLDHSLPDSVREQQMALIEFLPYNQKSEVLIACLNNTEPLKLQESALQQLSKYDETDIGMRIVKLWKELGPQTRRLASDLLLYKELHHDALLTGLENGTINIGEMNFDLERRRTLLWWTDNENTKRRAEKLFSDSGVINRKEAIDRMKDALTIAGSSINGEKIFTSICSNCHMYGSIGKEVGPVLTEINRKSKESLLHDILDPNAAVETRYINHRLETKSGEIHIGIVDSESDQSITIKKMGGEIVKVNKDDIKSLFSLGSSLMMEGLEGSISPQEMADLLAFLQGV